MNLFLIFIFMVLALAFLLLGIFSIPKVSSKRLIPTREEDLGQMKKSRLNLLLSNILPFSQRLLAILKLDVKIKKQLEACHTQLTVAGFFNLKLLLISFLLIVAMAGLGKRDPAALAVCTILGYIIPDIWLNARIRRRKNAIISLLPETIDLLGLCVEAGLDFVASLKWIIDKTVSVNPLIEELAFLVEEVKWGKSRAQALKDMAKRLNITEINSFAQYLIQAERLGTPVTEAFKIISVDTREERFQRGQRLALQAPIKILIPLIFCMLPAIGIIIAGPIFLQFMQGGIMKTFGG